MRLVKDARLSLTLTEVMKIARLTSPLLDAPRQSSPRPRLRHGRRLALLFNHCTIAPVYGSVLSPLLFAIVVDVITENARRGVVNKLLYADDLVLMSETMKDLKNRFCNWKDALESKG